MPRKESFTRYSLQGWQVVQNCPISAQRAFFILPSFPFHVKKRCNEFVSGFCWLILLSWNQATYWCSSFYSSINSCRSMVLELRKRYLNESVQFSLHWGIFCVLLLLCCQVYICIKIMIFLNWSIPSCNCVFYLIRILL